MTGDRVKSGRLGDYGGEPDIAASAQLIGDPTRARMLMALLDGRALPMSMLAGEAGVAASTASGHLGKLVDAELLRVRKEGRHRYYALASADVAQALEALARLSPQLPIRSLRAGTRANALRAARTCYDHLAGHLGTALMESFVDSGAVVGGDGRHHEESARQDHLAAQGKDLDYRITEDGWRRLGELGVVIERTPRRLVRYCVDWTEQRHHLAGALGAALLTRFVELGWVRQGRGRNRRVVTVTELGSREFRRRLAVELPPSTRPIDPGPLAGGL